MGDSVKADAFFNGSNWARRFTSLLSAFDCPSKLKARSRRAGKVIYAVAAGDALSRPNSSATACSTTLPLKKPVLLRVCSMAALANVNSRNSCSVKNPTMMVMSYPKRFRWLRRASSIRKIIDNTPVRRYCSGRNKGALNFLYFGTPFVFWAGVYADSA